jgi:hypothetical protein
MVSDDGDGIPKDNQDLQRRRGPPLGVPSQSGDALIISGIKHGGKQTDLIEAIERKKFFDYADPLFSVRISTASCVGPVGAPRIARDSP